MFLVAWRWIACLWLLFAAPWASGVSVRFAPEKNYPPFVFQAPSGEMAGLSIDMLRAIKPHLKFPVEELEPRALHEILAAARTGDVDLISPLRPTEERRKYLEFSTPYASVPAVLVLRAGDTETELDSLEGLTVAVGAGYAAEEYVKKAYPRVKWLSTQDDENALRLLGDGKVKGVVADVASAHYLIKKNAIRNVDVRSSVGFEYRLAFAWRKELDWLGKDVEHGMSRLNAHERNAILARWNVPEMSAYTDQRTRWVGFAGLALAFFLAIFTGRKYIGLMRRSA